MNPKEDIYCLKLTFLDCKLHWEFITNFFQRCTLASYRVLNHIMADPFEKLQISIVNDVLLECVLATVKGGMTLSILPILRKRFVWWVSPRVAIFKRVVATISASQPMSGESWARGRRCFGYLDDLWFYEEASPRIWLGMPQGCCIVRPSVLWQLATELLHVFFYTQLSFI